MLTKTKARPASEPQLTPYDGSGSIQAARLVVVVQGIKPLLTHNPEKMGETKGPSKASRIPEPAVEAENGTYRLEDGTCAIKGESFRSSLLSAASAWKAKGKTTMRSQLSHVVVTDDLLPLQYKNGDPINSFAIDRRRVRVQKAGIMRSRPRFDEWQVKVTFEYDPQLVADPKVMIVDILNDAGNRFGVGDYRAGSGGPFGRFRVIAHSAG